MLLVLAGDDHEVLLGACLLPRWALRLLQGGGGVLGGLADGGPEVCQGVAVGLGGVAEDVESGGVVAGELGEGVDGEQQGAGLVVADVEDFDGDLGVGGPCSGAGGRR